MIPAQMEADTHFEIDSVSRVTVLKFGAHSAIHLKNSQRLPIAPKIKIVFFS